VLKVTHRLIVCLEKVTPPELVEGIEVDVDKETYTDSVSASLV
jgi:hypothetical protein